MKYNRAKLKGTLLLSIGFLLVSGSFITNRYDSVPDFLRGSLIGIGLALEVIALRMMQRNKKCLRQS